MTKFVRYYNFFFFFKRNEPAHTGFNAKQVEDIRVPFWRLWSRHINKNIQDIQSKKTR